VKLLDQVGILDQCGQSIPQSYIRGATAERAAIARALALNPV